MSVRKTVLINLTVGSAITAVVEVWGVGGALLETWRPVV